MGGAGMGQGGMNDEWTVSLLGRTGWWEAFFNIIFYIQLWVRTGCGYAVPDPSKGGKSIVLKQGAVQMIYLCSNASLSFFGGGHRQACARARVCMCVRECVSVCLHVCPPMILPVSSEPIISSSETR